jgi:putative ABC transport system ATP-binding protein
VSHAVIELDGIARTYTGPPTVTALQPTSLVVGPSGSGKSTLLNLLGLLDRPSAGSYRLDGVPTQQMSERQRSAFRGQRLGFVFQAYHLLALRTAVENVELSLLYAGVPPTERRLRARESLAQVALSHREDGIASQLSGGERQRVAIARALAGRPSVLLCDEPTGNLDSANARAVLDLLDELNSRGVTMIVITHDPEVARRGRRRLRIVDGVVTEAGDG